MPLLKEAVETESEKFEKLFMWLQENMRPAFFDEVGEGNLRLITHILMEFDLQEFFARFHLKDRSFVMCLESPDADLRILKQFQMHGIKSYRAFVSKTPPPFKGARFPLRIASVFLTEEIPDGEKTLPKEQKDNLFTLVKERNPKVTRKTFNKLASAMSPRFLRSVPQDRLVPALNMFAKAQESDLCQYEVSYNYDWKETKVPSVQIVFAWKNVPKHNFMHRLAKTVYRHNLVMKRVNALDIDPYSNQSFIVMAIGLHGMHGKPAWEEADMDDFLKELITVKYFGELENVEALFVDSKLIRGNLGNLVKTIIHFVHQALVCENSHLYSFSNIEEALCRHPELTVMLTEAFEWKFHPKKNNLKQYEATREAYLSLVDQIDTGHEANDTRRKNILNVAMLFIHCTLKTNVYRSNKTGHSFRLDPAFLDGLPYDRKEKFPEIPFAIIFMKGMQYIGFHIRFKDLSRGGLRTVVPTKMEQLVAERNATFTECYNLAYTQQKKNKDIPEGGSKGVILMEPYERLRPEEEIYRRELKIAGMESEEIQQTIVAYRKVKKLEYLHETQRSYIDCLLPLVNCEDDGTLRVKSIVDYYKKPEYIYLGPDENMHNETIEWISNYSIYYNYKPKSCFISSKPGAGINHKEYGVTSLGVNTYMIEVLKYLGIDPAKAPFTVKISGGPDGDVVGNQILNLYNHFPKTAKLLALVDVSGTIFDPEGLDLKLLAQFFKEEKAIRYYPPEKLTQGGFLLDLFTKREPSPYIQQTLCYRMTKNGLTEEWLSGNEMNHLLKTNVHKTKTDIFIPAGGRPKTLRWSNHKEFLDETGRPTSKAIIEGANLYFTPRARNQLEKHGVLIIKDSSANKGGVICSSFEVLAGLVFTEKEFLEHKAIFMKETLAIIERCALNEAKLLLGAHAKTNEKLTTLSETVSHKINTYTYQLLDHLKDRPLSDNPKDPLIQCLLNYCPPFLRNNYEKRILSDVPDIHKKAIIASYIASRLVYSRGIEWSPTIVDTLPIIAKEFAALLD